MDERHWWIATKLQQSFQSESLEHTQGSFAEDFLADQTMVEKINDFLTGIDSKKLIFYALRPPLTSEDSESDKIQVVSSAVRLKDLLQEDSVAVVFIRMNTEQEIEPSNVEKEIFVLEIKQNPLTVFSSLLNFAFVPMLKAQSQWGESSPNEVMDFLIQADKYAATLQDYSSSVNVSNLLLKRPDMQLTNDFNKSRVLTINPSVIAECEHLVQNWMQTIEALLSESLEDRPDYFSGPLSELDLWHRRQKVLYNIADQLKNKECKTVIGILITAKSRILKKWKLVDAGLTDALNETKDKVKYLESLRKHFEQLYEDHAPSFFSTVTIPALISAVRQMDNISRFYARTGYLGIIFAKVTNQLVISCKRTIQQAILKKYNSDSPHAIWQAIQRHITQQTTDTNKPQFKPRKGAHQSDTAQGDFLALLNSCLYLQKQVRDQVRYLKDALGGAHSLQHVPASSFGLVKKYGSPSVGNISVASSRLMNSNMSPGLLAPEKPSNRAQSAASVILTGISFTDEEAIIGHLDLFSHRVHNLIEIIETVKEFSHLAESVSGLPVIDVRGKSDEDEVEVTKSSENGDAIIEEDGFDEEQYAKEENDKDEDELDHLTISTSDLNEASLTVAQTISRYISEIEDLIDKNLTLDNVLIVEGKAKICFENVYANFVQNIKAAEKFISDYLKSIFKMKWKTKRAIDILACFNPVSTRHGLRSILCEKYVEAFVLYEKDLDDVQSIYETHKENPPIARNAPKVSGSIFWVRALLRRIEEPMRVFRDVRFISTLKDFGRVVKYYNRIATALVKFEELWISAWKSQIESVKIGLKAPLLRLKDESKRIDVNVDNRVLEVMNEVKWMRRLKLSIPNNANEISLQEDRFKHYYHQLTWIIKLYREICEEVPQPLRKLMQPLTESISYHLQPGLSTLTWSSLNIDAYLHQCHSALQKLQETVRKIVQLVDDGLTENIAEIKRFTFFNAQGIDKKSWDVDEFIEKQNKFNIIAIKRLNKRIASMESTLQTIASVIAQQILATTSSSPSPPSTPGFPPSIHVNVSRTNSSEVHRISKHGKSLTSPLTGVLDDALYDEVKVYYCSQVYDAVLIAVRDSLSDFKKSLQCSTEDFERNQLSGKLTDGTMMKSSTQFEVEVQFILPDIRIEPSLSIAQSAIDKVAAAIVNVSKAVQWWAKDTSKTFYSSIQSDDTVIKLNKEISTMSTDLQRKLDSVLLSFRKFDFLWRDDLQVLFAAFVETNPGLSAFHREVERLQAIEQDLMSVSDHINLGPLLLKTAPIKDSLFGFAVAWKICYAQSLHENAKLELKAIVEKRESFRSQLTTEVSSLDQLNDVLNLLQELHDLENTIDDVYLPVETTYSKLLAYNIQIARDEIVEIQELRNKWSDLLLFAAEVRTQLLMKKRSVFEQELDKQVKTFVVEVIQFRNSFDSQGPGVPGVSPSEAVRRLTYFHEQFQQLDHRRRVLDAVQVIFGIAPTRFPELDRTGEELQLLKMLYGLYQTFINFDQKFRDQLWAEVDLSRANDDIEMYWRGCSELPLAIRGWNAYKEMRDSIKSYMDVFPLLTRLASREIRNRHWLEVMAVTGSSFQLEANVFKLMHLLDSHLVKHKEEIEEIVQNAGKELDLEIRIRAIEEEWTEQVLSFEKFKSRGLVCLDNENTEKLLELSEDAKASLAAMLTSKHVTPLREEAAIWAVKLKEVAEVLEQWLSVQELWQCLEEVFSNSITAKELPQESSRFSRVDRSYMRTMKKAVEVRNVMQCCIGGDVPKNQMLKGLHEELEICFKSLAGYLNKKRKDFPRFYFVNDTALLNILSKPHNLDSVKLYLPSIFSGIQNIQVVQSEAPLSRKGKKFSTIAADVPGLSVDSRRASVEQSKSTYADSHQEGRLSKLDFSNKQSNSILDHSLVGEEWRRDFPQLKIVSVSDSAGEVIKLESEIRLEKGVESWLKQLLQHVTRSVQKLLKRCSDDIHNGMLVEDWIFKYPTQVVLMNLMNIWTQESETAVAEIRMDRKALPNALRKFTTFFNKIPHIISRGAWRNSDVALNAVHTNRLETLVSVGLHLRDILEDLGKRKLRDVTDFEWQRNLRFYFQTDEEGKQDCLSIQMLDAQFLYGNEFLNCSCPIMLTPLTERCFLSLTQAISSNAGGCLVGPTSSGKTQTIKGLSYLFGKFLISISCLSTMDANAFGRIFTGVAQEASWCLFDELQQASSKILSIITYHVQHILTALKSNQSTCSLLDSQMITVLPSLAIFTTITQPPESSHSLPHDALCPFRMISLVKPDYSVILKTHFAAQGFKAYKMLADKVKLLADICLNQLSVKSHILFNMASLISITKRAGQRRLLSNTKFIDSEMEFARGSSAMSTANTFALSGPRLQGRDRKLTTPITMSGPIKAEHALVFRSLTECVGSRLSQEDQVIFSAISKDVFGNIIDRGAVTFSKEEQAIESTLIKIVQEKGLVAHPPWILKAMQLYQLSKVFQGVIVCGAGGSGKTSCIESLVEALNEHAMSKQLDGNNKTRMHKLEHINVVAVDNLSLMFGMMKSSGDWADGVFTSIWKRANKQHTVAKTTNWLCFDAPITDAWNENLKSVLDRGQYLTMANVERLQMSGNVKILFETGDIQSASPSVVSRMGLVLIDDKVLGWRPLADGWLCGRPTQQVHILQRAFGKVIDPVLNFMDQEARPCLKLSETALFSSCLTLLSALLQEHTDLGGDLHTERLFVFSLIWTFGGLLTREQDKNSFSQLLLSVSTALPDYDHHISVFDYYVDESGEWDNWEARLPDISYGDSLDLLEETFVETVDTMRARFIMELVSSMDRNILLIGPRGSGKTCMINDFYNQRENKNTIIKRMAYSAGTTAALLQKFMEDVMYHRQGFVYGAEDNKKLMLFIDDLNVATTNPDNTNFQSTNELLRQLVDSKMIFNLQKPFDRRYIEDLSITASLSISDAATLNTTQISDRLLRHFTVIQLPEPKQKTIQTIASAMLEANMGANECLTLPHELHEQIVQASCHLLTRVSDVLRPSPMLGRRNYQFDLKDLKRIFQSLKNCPEELRIDDDENYLILFWQHEARRVFEDRIAQTADINWLENTFKDITKQYFESLTANAPYSLFTTFAADAHLQAHRSFTQVSRSSGRKIAHQAIQGVSEVYSCLQSFLTRYNEQYNKELPLALCDHTMKHLIRIYRIVCFKSSGNALLIGSIGTHLVSMARLVLYMVNIPIYHIDCTNRSSFFDGLRSAVRTAGCEGKQTALVLTGPDLRDKSYLDAIDNILTNGSCPLLFTEEELKSLISALLPAIKKGHSSFLSDPMKFFEIRVKLNLHIIVCLQPRNPTLMNLARDYPGILAGCHINWAMDWPSDALYGIVAHYLDTQGILAEFDPELQRNVMETMIAIHGHILRDCNQIPWAGDAAEPDEQVDSDGQLPYSKSILLNRILHKDVSWHGTPTTGIFVGPTTFHGFMHCFKYVFKVKAAKVNEKVRKRKKALSGLSQARMNVSDLKETISKLKSELAVSTKTTGELLNALIAKATLRERLRAKLGIGSSSLKAFMALIDGEMEDETVDSILIDDYDEMDEEYEKIKLTQQVPRASKTFDELMKDAEDDVEVTKRELDKAISKVDTFQKRVDRGCIERLRAFQNPTPMVGMTMVMLMILIGRPEFASYVASSQGREREKRTGEGGSMSFSDEASRISSATSRRRKDTVHKPAYSSMGLTSDGRNVDKNTWKTIQNIMNDSQKFAESLNNQQWEQGISDEVLKTVVSFFAPGEERPFVPGPKASVPSTPTSKYSSPQRTNSPDKKNLGLSLAAARYSSEDAAHLVEYCQAVIEFTRKNKPYLNAKKVLKDLQDEKELIDSAKSEKKKEEEIIGEDEPPHVDPVEGLTEDDLPAISQEIEDLQKQFDENAIHKYNLSKQINDYSEKLKSLNELIESLKPIEMVWKYFLEDYTNCKVLLTNSICAAAFLTYCGPMGIDQRKRMAEFFLNTCKDNNVPAEKKKIFNNISLAKFLVGKQMLRFWKALRFPTDNMSLDNVCITTQTDCCIAWALICDPQRVAVHWIAKLLHDTTVVKFKELRGELEKCLIEGRSLLITDIDLKDLESNEKLYSLSRGRPAFIGATAPFKLAIGGEEIECSPGFRLFLITTNPAYTIPSSVAAYANVIEFCQSREGLTEQFLYRFIKLEKPRIHDTLAQVAQEIVTHLSTKNRAEEQLLDNFCDNEDPFCSLVCIKKAALIKRVYDEAQESLSKARSAEMSIQNSRETYRSIAVCAATLFDVSRTMSAINPLYQMSFAQFVAVFDMAIKHSDRNAVSSVVEKVQFSTFISKARGLFEEDRPIFALLVALEIEDSLGKLSIGDREFLISPPFGAAIKQLAYPKWEIPLKTTGKKPFDWLLDEQYYNLQLLAQYYDWFTDTFEKMPKEGRETQWRQIAEYDKPELLSMPENLDDKYLPIQRLLVMRAIRSDRLLQASSVFVTMSLGKKYSSDVPMDLPFAARQSSVQCPILLLYRKESEVPESLVTSFAASRQVEVQVIRLCGISGEETYAKKAIQMNMKSGGWLLLLNGQNCIHLLESLDSFLQEATSFDQNFRLWISSNDDPCLPASILQTSVKIFVDTPKMSLKSSLTRNFSWIDPEVWKKSMRNEWLPLLHNACMLHSTLRLRHRFSFVGLNRPYEFDFPVSKLWQSFRVLVDEFSETQTQSSADGSPGSTPVQSQNQRNVQWNGIRYMLSEIVYGNGITSEIDTHVLGALVELWINSSATRRDFDISKVKYKLPGICFTPGAKYATIAQALENMSVSQLDSPEMCGLYSSEETPLSDDQYIFTRLNALLDYMPSSSTLTHVAPTSKVLRGSATPFVVSSGAFHAVGAGLLPLVDMSVFASASLTALRTSAEVNLNEVCTNALTKLPRLWSREFISERIRKLGGTSPFNLFLLSEIDCFSQLHQEIKSTFQAIKLATSEGSYGDTLPEQYLQDAEELYHLKIPTRFRTLGGLSSPPNTWSLANWLIDLQARFNHFEKILYQGKEKVPAYWLAAFFNPKRMLAVVMQEAIRQYEAHSVVTEQFVFRTEITGRDKDHLREPPTEGLFIYGIYLWGCSWEKTIGELQDASPKSGPSLLPVIHVTAIPYSEKPSLVDAQKSQFCYECPCYASRVSERDPLFLVDIEHKDIPGTRWPLRGISCTLRPF
eukprot:gene407-1042_t